MERAATGPVPHYDPQCYLCPGNARAGGRRNPEYTQTFAFENDFPVLAPDTPRTISNEGDLLVAETERGRSRVLCFSPRHDLTIAGMQLEEVRAVVDAWAAEFAELGALPEIHSVQIFENRGSMMGASNPHPHCQIWASEWIPDQIAKENASQLEYYDERWRCLLCDYLAIELRGPRLVYENEGFAVLVPFWAVWPFETMILSKRHVGDMTEFSGSERDQLADILRQTTSRYDRVFDAPFPYTMGFHQRPTDGAAHHEWHFHAHYLPPLLRSATVRKFMVGFELLAAPQRDITAEMAAERLRSLG